MSTILEELETTIAGLKADTTRSNVGTVREVGDGVAKLEGLSDVMLNEMLEFPGGLYGLALNLEETPWANRSMVKDRSSRMLATRSRKLRPVLSRGAA